MKISVIICTLNRPEVLHGTILSILRQILPPIEILVASPSQNHLLKETLELPGVKYVPSGLGSCRQRNAALDVVDPSSDLVAFLDDDIELSRFYLSRMAQLFSSHLEIIVASGTMLHDGGRSTRVSREKALSLCEDYDAVQPTDAPLSYQSLDSGYGCNMVCRKSGIRNVRFDEALPLYAWLEDRDFSHRCTHGLHGPVTSLSSAGVHLGWRAGRVSGVRLGFSTIVNPMYLKRKANTFSLQFIVVNYWLRCVAGNILGIITRDHDYDRVGLLRGNVLGFKHLLSGKCDPQFILNLPG